MTRSIVWGVTLLVGWLAQSALAEPTTADLIKGLGLKATATGQVINACDEAVTPELTPIDFGGDLGTAWLLLIPGGPEQASCYGDVPGEMHLFSAAGAEVFSGGGYVTVLPSATQGVHDFALGGPGMSFPVYRWTGSAFTVQGEMSNDDLTALGTLPSYP